MTDIPQDFETAMSELEALVGRLEGGDLPLTESLAAYQRGHALLAWCQSQLQSARQQVQILEGQADSQTLQPFEADTDE